MRIYGAPLITPANTVVVPVRITNGFKVNVFEGATGRSKYTLATPYAHIHFPIWSDCKASRIHFGRVHPAEILHLAAVGIDLNEKQQPTDLVEIEVKGFTTPAIRSDHATHQAAFADRN